MVRKNKYREKPKRIKLKGLRFKTRKLSREEDIKVRINKLNFFIELDIWEKINLTKRIKLQEGERGKIERYIKDYGKELKKIERRIKSQKEEVSKLKHQLKR